MKIHRMLTVILFPILLAAPLAAQAAAGAGAETSWCGAHPARLAGTLARHQRHQRQLERHPVLAETSGRARTASVNVYHVDQLAIIEDDGTLIAPAAPFDLSGKSIQFLRRPRGMSVVRSAVGYKDQIGERLLLPFGSSYVPFTDGFELPFFDQVYSGVRVSEAGYLRFDERTLFSHPDNELDLLTGPPSIAVFFADLDPSAATNGNGVYVQHLPRRVRITWLGVPEAGSGNLVTAQVTLFDNGRILFAYGDVAASRGIVGVFPGGGVQIDAYPLDISEELPQPPRQAAYFETFSDAEKVDELALTEAFYERFQDRYDHLVVWADFPLASPGGDGSFQVTLKNDVEGIGMPRFDLSRSLGLNRLESYVQMGDLGQYPANPNEIVFDTYSTMDVLAHQVGHRWLGLVRHRSYYNGNQGGEVIHLLDPVGAEHWSFHFDTGASVLGGNDIRDNGDGTFTTVGATSQYCDLDLYLMGLIPAAAVPSFFYVGSVASPPSWHPPETGVTMTGDRVEVAIDDVTDAIGTRVPASADAPKVFSTAFVLLVREGEPPSVESLEKLGYFRRYWHRYFKEATHFHGRVNTSLRVK